MGKGLLIPYRDLKESNVDLTPFTLLKNKEIEGSRSINVIERQTARI